jgi:hypothetical protein
MTTICADVELELVLDEDEDEDPAPEAPLAAAPENELPLEDDPEPPLEPVELDPEEPVDELDDEPDPVTCWPTVRLTDATVPAMVDTSVASESEVWALLTWVWAEAMLASSEAIWAADALLVWSVAS